MPSSDVPATLPRLLRRVWAQGDPASQSERQCDAQDRHTEHTRFETVAGAYWLCAECGQMHRDGDPGDQGGLYDDWWRKRIAEFDPSERELGECRAWLERIEPHRATGRLFEVGAGLGVFLKTAAEAGWKPEGNDLSPVAATFATELCGGRVAPGPMENVDLEDNAYDVILCNNVFEHLLAPRVVLQNLARALRPGGVIFFQTLSCQSLSLWFAPRHWLYYGEGHLFIPSLKSLDAYFNGAGVRAIRRETHGFRSTPWDPKTGRKKTRMDKVLAQIAGRTGRGHRVKMLLQKGGGAEGTKGPRDKGTKGSTSGQPLSPLVS